VVLAILFYKVSDDTTEELLYTATCQIAA